MDLELGKVVVADFDFQRVVFIGARVCDLQSGFGAGATNQAQHLVQTIQHPDLLILIGPNKQCSTGFHFDAPVW
jgi:hypothetical protein